MKSKSQQRRELAWSALAVVLSGVTVLTCSALGGSRSKFVPSRNASSVESSPAGWEPSPPTASEVRPANSEEPGSVGRWIAPAELGSSEEGNGIPRLPRFYEALAGLATGLRHDHVRIVWLGDSHTQADVWPNTVRSKLQKKFGNGGPGFVHVGWDTHGYRHEQIGLQVGGGWSILPVKLVSDTPVEDGVFGLGGVRLVPQGMGSLSSVAVSPKGLPGKGLWDLAVRFTNEDAELSVNVNGVEHLLAADPRTLGAIQHFKFETEGPGGALRVEDAWSRPELMGVVVESVDDRGVVVDTLGLNGARVRTALAWDETTWVSELSRREPDLVVLAFGTNESSDMTLKRERHADRVKELLARVRKAAPNSDCLVIGPIDRGGDDFGEVIERINEAQEWAAAESACAFWNGQRAMGGRGSMHRWAMASPPLGAGDHIHLHSPGYQKLGEMMARDMLDGYRKGVGAESEDAATVPQ